MVKSISIGISLIIFIIWILDILLTPNIKKNEKFYYHSSFNFER